jgi:inner membrane protein
MKKESVMIRVLFIFFIILGLLIPLFMIQSLIDEREVYRNSAVMEIEKSWASNQTLAGPIITAHYSKTAYNSNGEAYTASSSYYYLPDSLKITGDVSPETRYRGIYEAVVYSSKIRITGRFNLKNLEANKVEGAEEQLHLSFNIDDLRGIRDKIILKINGEEVEVNPGLKTGSFLRNGFFAEFIPKAGVTDYAFELDLSLNGSEGLSFVPLGKYTELELKSNWTNPSFSGNFLPVARDVSEKGFTAKWQVNYFNRDYPQEWANRTYEIFPSAFSVKFLMPVDQYQQSMRASKYGLMIITLTFICFFLIEIFSGKTLHPIQYLLIGLSLVIFYALLVSLSEYILFQYAYLIAAVMVIALISFYVKSVFASSKLGAQITGLLIAAYGFMYVILQLQDYSLLLGNIALFTVLGIVMYLTRKVNWSEIFSRNSSENKI